MLDLILRGAAIGAAMTGGIVILSRSRSSGAMAILAFVATMACYLVVSAPGAAGLAKPLELPLIAGAMLAPLALTWMMLELLTDGDMPRWPWLALAAVTVAASFLSLVWPPAAMARAGLVLALYVGLIWLAVLSDRGDLVASRRLFRRAVLAVMAVMGVVISAIELAGLDTDLPRWLFPLQAAVFWGLAQAFCIWALLPSPDLFQRPAEAPHSPARPRPDVIAKLDAAMADGAWQREGLTIGALATDLGVPEHRLRATINQELGHRNFATYINGHRIEAACAQLSDPALAGKTVLEIAFDSGFASLGPFNKAFRAQTGQSPTAYRAAHLG